jgi:hypothetical protein
VTDSDLAALKKAMADAHPDRGGTVDAFIKARRAYLAAKWLRTAAAQRRQREEAEAAKAETERRWREAAAEEERRRREAAKATARFKGRAAKAICAYAAVLLVYVLVAFHKEHPVTGDAGRHGDLAATSTTPTLQFLPWNDAVSDSPRTPIENASTHKPRPVATVAVTSDSIGKNEVDATIRSAAAAPSTPEQRVEAPLQTVTPVAPEVTPPASPVPLTPARQAAFVVYYLTTVENRGDVDDLSAYYSDIINYYGKPTAKSDVVADKMRFMRRWPNRKYTIRPQSLTVACDIMRCTVDGMIDFDVSNAGKRSIGAASFTYHMLMKHNNSEPPDLLVTAENSIVVRRTVTDIGQPPAQTVAAPWPADRGRGQ